MSGAVLALIAAVVIFAASPGPAVFAIVARTLSHGLWPGALFLLGCVLGDVIYLLLAVYGLSYVAGQMGELFVIVKALAAAYLVWLGIRLWRADPAPSAAAQTAPGALRGLGAGALVTLASPKAMFFFGALLPTFLDLPALTHADVALLAALVAGAILAVNMLYVLAALRARRMFRSRRAVRWLNRVSATVLIGAGAAVAAR